MADTHMNGFLQQRVANGIYHNQWELEPNIYKTGTWPILYQASTSEVSATD